MSSCIGYRWNSDKFRKKVTGKVQHALDQFVAAGGRIILASGRPTYGIVPVAETLGLPKKGDISWPITVGVSWIVRQEDTFMKKICLRM